MPRKKIKFLVGAFMIILAIGFLIGSTINSTSTYFMTVSELHHNGMDNYYDAGLKVKGNVVDGSIQRDPQNSLDVAFRIKENDDILKVVYNGITPDMFNDGGEVVVEGTLAEDGVFHANTLLTSCPSKYEAEKEKGKTHPGSLPDFSGAQKPKVSPETLPKAKI